jgi:hypothetical protein
MAALRAERMKLSAQIDRAVALADREVGIRAVAQGSLSSPAAFARGSGEEPQGRTAGPALQNPVVDRQPLLTPAPLTTTGGLPVAPTRGIPPVPAPEGISLADYRARVEAGWVPVMGLPGTPITAGFLRELGEYNPKMEGVNAIWTYQEMRRGDAQVASVLRGCKLPILAAQWQVKPPPDSEIGNRKLETKGLSSFQFPGSRFQVSSNGAGQATAAKAKEISNFIRENLFSGLEWPTHTGSWVTQDWKEVVRYGLRMLDFGAACYEEVMAVDGDRIRVRRLADRQALTFYRWHTDPHAVDPSIPPYVYDDGETLYALEQWGYRSNRFEYVLLPTEKACIFTHDQEGANFWGIPLTRAMYPHWYLKHHLSRINAIACERNGLGVPLILLPPNPSRQDVAAAQQWVTSLAAHEKTGLSLPHGAEFKMVGIEGQIREILPAIEYEDAQIARCGFMNFMELGQRSTGSGSRAVGGVQAKFFYLASQYEADFIAARIRNTTIRRLVLFNFGPEAPVPYLVPSNVQARALEEAADIISKLAAVGAWISDRGSVNQVRNELGYDAFVDEEAVLARGVAMPGKAGTRDSGARD